MKKVGYVEKFIYFVCGIVYFITRNIYNLNIFLFIFLLAILIYHFILCSLIEKLNVIHGTRFLKKNFKEYDSDYEVKNTEELKIPNRKKDIIVILIFLIYISIVYFLSIINKINVNWLLTGLCVLLFLNSIFKYEICFIRIMLYKKEINCCMDCHINGWDNVLIFSVLGCLYFFKEIFLFNKVLVGVILISSFIQFILWEWNLSFNIERYFPSTNANLNCDKCQKKESCNGNERFLFKNNGIKIKVNTYQKVPWYKQLEEYYVWIGIITSLIILFLTIYIVGIEYFLDYCFFIIVFFFEIPLWRVIYKWIRKKYEILFENNLYPIIKDIVHKDVDKIKAEYSKNLFEIRNIHDIIIFSVSYLIIIFSCVILIVNEKFKLPELSTIEKGIMYFIICIIWLIACKAFVIFYNAIKEFGKIASWDIKRNYYFYGTYHLDKIRKFCNESVFIISLVSISLEIAILKSPILNGEIKDLSKDMKYLFLLILIILSLLPTVILLGSIRFISKIKDRMIFNELKKFNKVVKKEFKKFSSLKEIDETIKLSDNIMGYGTIKKNINKTVFFTFFTGLVQCIAILYEFGIIENIKNILK